MQKKGFLFSQKERGRGRASTRLYGVLQQARRDLKKNSPSCGSYFCWGETCTRMKTPYTGVVVVAPVLSSERVCKCVCVWVKAFHHWIRVIPFYYPACLTLSSFCSFFLTSIVVVVVVYSCFFCVVVVFPFVFSCPFLIFVALLSQRKRLFDTVFWCNSGKSVV